MMGKLYTYSVKLLRAQKVVVARRTATAARVFAQFGGTARLVERRAGTADTIGSVSIARDTQRVNEHRRERIRGDWQKV